MDVGISSTESKTKLCVLLTATTGVAWMLFGGALGVAATGRMTWPLAALGAAVVSLAQITVLRSTGGVSWSWNAAVTVPVLWAVHTVVGYLGWGTGAPGCGLLYGWVLGLVEGLALVFLMDIDVDPGIVETGKSWRARRRLKSLVAMGGLAAVVVAVALLTPRHRGRVNLDPSRIEAAAFPPSCVTVLGPPTQATVQLLSLAPEKTAGGMTAVLSMRVCNPTNLEYKTPDIAVSYAGMAGRPGISWRLEPLVLGSGFCEDVTVATLPLGELVRFEADKGVFEVSGSNRVLHLPSCAPPTAIPLPTATATPRPTPLPDFDYSNPRISSTPHLMELAKESLQQVLVFAELDRQLLEVGFGKRPDSEENDTLLREVPQVKELAERLPWLAKVEGRPTCMVIGDRDRTVYLFPVVSGETVAYMRYADAVEPLEMASDSGLRKRGYKILAGEREAVHLVGSAVGDPKPDLLVNVTVFPFALPTPTPTPPPLPPTPRPTTTPRPSPTPVPTCVEDGLESEGWRDAPLLGSGRYQLRMCGSSAAAPYRDLEWFRVQGREDEEIQAELAFDGSRADVRLLLQTAPAERGGKLVTTSSPGHRDLQVLRYESESDRVYYLVVTLGDGGSAKAVDYELRLFDGSPPACVDDERGTNDEQGDASRLGSGTSTHHLCPRYNFLGLPEHEEQGYVDVDWYKLTVAASASSVDVTVWWQRHECDLDLDLYVRERGLHKVAGSASRSGVKESVSYAHGKDKGTYYAVVKLASSASCLDERGVEYTLTVEGAEQ